MNENKFESRRGSLERAELIDDFNLLLTEALGEDIGLESIDGTWFVETDELDFSFTISDECIEVRNIESRKKGLGKSVLSLVQDFAEENDKKVIASNVDDEAISFWQQMGYVEGDEGQYFLP